MNLLGRKIRKIALLGVCLIAVVFGFAWAGQSDAQIAQLLNFSGKVTNIDGSEVADGTYNFSFALYIQPTGGASIWSENLTAGTRFSGQISGVSELADSIRYTYTGGSATTTFRLGQYLSTASSTVGALIIDFSVVANTVTVASGSPVWSVGETINNRPFVEGGIVNINLGSVSALSNINFNQTLYLEVVFNSETMQPRKAIVPTAQAWQASQVGDKTEAELAGLADNETITGEWSFDNTVSIATTSANTVLTVTQDGSGDIIAFKHGTTTRLAVLADGRVQIGDYYFPTSYAAASPGYVLKVNAGGNLYWDIDFAGSGGGSGLWASSSNNLYIYQSDSGQVVVLGDTATSSPYNAQFEVQGSSWFDDIGISDQFQLHFYDADSSNYFAWQATTTMGGNVVLSLPGTAGMAGQAMLSDGNNNLYWGSPTSYTYVNPGLGGELSYYETSGSQLFATSSIYLNQRGYFGIGTTTLNDLFTVGAVSGSQFIVDSTGQAVGGSWQADQIATLYGGTGTSSAWWTGIPFVDSGVWAPTTTLIEIYGGTGQSGYATGDLLYAAGATALSRLPIGSESHILTVGPAGVPIWVSTSTLDIDASSMTGILDLAHGGTGQNFASSTGFIYLDNGLAIASSTLRIGYTDLAASSGIVLSGNMLTLNASGDWTGTFDGKEGSYYLNAINLTNFATPFSAAFDATTTDALEQGSVNLYYGSNLFAADLAATNTDALSQGIINLYWTDAKFDFRLAATTSLVNLVSLAGLSEIGTIATGTWQADTIQVAYGGTGFTSISNQSLVYASSDNTLDGFSIGNEGEVLAIVSGQLAWATTSAPSAHAILSVSHSDAEATSTLVRGDLLIADSNAKWNRMALGASGYILYSDGTDAAWATTTNITALGTILTGIWQADTIGIAYGGTGASTATGARANLGLTEAAKFGINSTGTTGWLWQSDGDGRGQWIATGSLGISAANNSTFIGTTSVKYTGEFSTTTLRGYQAANYLCDSEYAGSHFCRTYDIIVTIDKGDISTWNGSAWIAEGPPGYTSNSNDCNGWISSSAIMLGAFWAFDSDGGGAGWLTNCSNDKPLACCKVQ